MISVGGMKFFRGVLIGITLRNQYNPNEKITNTRDCYYYSIFK